MLPGPPILEFSEPQAPNPPIRITQPRTLVSPSPPALTRYASKSPLLSPCGPSFTKSPSRKPLRATIYENRRVGDVQGVTSEIWPSQNQLSPVESALTSSFSISFRLTPLESALTSLTGEGGYPTSMKYLPHSPALSFSALSSLRRLRDLCASASNLSLLAFHQAAPLCSCESLLESFPRAGSLS
jgi:hypothetical protein